MRFNGSSASNYSYQYLRGDGSGRAAARLTSQPELQIGASSGGTDTANVFGNHEVYIFGYNLSAEKLVSVNSGSENNADTPAYLFITAGRWGLNDAITSITLLPEGAATFSQFTSASLYKINTL